MAYQAEPGHFSKQYTYDYIKYNGTNSADIASWLSGYNCRPSVYLKDVGLIHDLTGGSASPYMVRSGQYIVFNLDIGTVEIVDDVSYLVPAA